MSDHLNFLKEIEALRPVPEGQLQWLLQAGEIIQLKEGEHLFLPGDPMLHTYVLLEGRLVFRIEQQGQFREVAQIKPGGITGTLPYSRAQAAQGYGVVVEPLTVLTLHRDRFPEMIRQHHELVSAFVHQMTSRVRTFTAQAQQNEKLMALGKISAGLAHELNNPASAVVRSSAELKKHLALVPDRFKQVMLMKLTPEKVDAVNEVLFSRLRDKPAGTMSLMDRTELEDEITDWLDQYGVEEATEIAETFVEFRLLVSDLDKIKEEIGEDFVVPVMRWLNSVLITEKLVGEIEDASRRINDLVKSVKTYSHMDQSADKQPADLAAGINSTLTMLNHKMKLKKILVDVDIPENLAHPRVFVGELNQVWTNLIDNAIDAMAEGGQLQVTAEEDREFVLTRIIDNGAGISEDIQQRIFDPFFTTKQLGEGTGLGLDIVQKIIRQHDGQITVDSRPGRTEFCVCLPIGEKQ